MKDRKEILEILHSRRMTIKKKYKVKKIGLFGSFVKGEQKKTSDIDILVEFHENADLFDFFALTLFLEENLNHKVDLVSKPALRKELRAAILSEVIYS